MHENIINYRLENFPGKMFIGNCLKMTFANNETKKLWQNFMPRRKEIRNSIGSELYSIQIYGVGFFDNFNPTNKFEKWAAVEVNNIEKIPEGMKALTIPEGLYAVFTYKGSPTSASGSYQYIFNDWIPNSKYELDTRPHFEILGDKYKNEDPMSEEEIWIPVRYKEQI